MAHKTKPLTPDVKRLLADHNIDEEHAEQRLTERGTHMMHSYLELLLLRLESDTPPEENVAQDARLHELVGALQHNVRSSVPIRL